MPEENAATKRECAGVRGLTCQSPRDFVFQTLNPNRKHRGFRPRCCQQALREAGKGRNTSRPRDGCSDSFKVRFRVCRETDSSTADHCPRGRITSEPRISVEQVRRRQQICIPSQALTLKTVKGCRVVVRAWGFDKWVASPLEAARYSSHIPSHISSFAVWRLRQSEVLLRPN